jgi:molybdenum cofactor biosynthesis enzyme MoaA
MGIDAAQRAGLLLKINGVALKRINQDEFEQMAPWAHGREHGNYLHRGHALRDIEDGAQQGESRCRKTVVSLSQ